MAIIFGLTIEPSFCTKRGKFIATSLVTAVLTAWHAVFGSPVLYFPFRPLNCVKAWPSSSRMILFGDSVPSSSSLQPRKASRSTLPTSWHSLIICYVQRVGKKTWRACCHATVWSKTNEVELRARRRLAILFPWWKSGLGSLTTTWKSHWLLKGWNLRWKRIATTRAIDSRSTSLLHHVSRLCVMKIFKFN